MPRSLEYLPVREERSLTVASRVRGYHGEVGRHTFTPELFGVQRAEPGALAVNAAAALVACGKAADFTEGMALGARSLDSGAARAKAVQLARLTSEA